ncbi:hypothetical protein [Shimia sp.]|uniref:hypothetical protein n=1 Tax=Shimia sp. TaxID=1954381 RepID=UPI003BACD6E4
MWRRILFFILVATGAAAQERPQGLLWNKTGLPATIPLQIKTTAEADYVLRLRAYETGEMALAAYIRGGEFFRVLVPPGFYELLFASGQDWQGEPELFGLETREFRLDPPLIFNSTATRREGYLIDLQDQEAITIRLLATCDRRAVDPDSLRGTRDPEDRVIGRPQTFDRPERPDKIPFARYEVQGRFCD